MKDLELSSCSPSIRHAFDLCPKYKLEKVTFGSKADTDIFGMIVGSLPKDGHSTQHAPTCSRQELASCTGEGSRNCNDKTGLVISVPLTFGSEVKLVGADRERERDEESAAVATDLGDDAHPVPGTPVQTTAESEPPYLVLPSDLEYLTDYTVLLFSQVKRGVMNESDLAKATRSKDRFELGFPGMRCRHCGGGERGNYFPTSVKNLQACQATLHDHLIKCGACPAAVIRALKMSKHRHKFHVTSRPPGLQSAFFSRLWERIHGGSVNGPGGVGPRIVLDRLDAIVERYAPKGPREERANRQAPGRRETDSENVVSEEDFRIALDLLRRAPTPDSPVGLDGEAPYVNVTPAPVGRWAGSGSPVATRISPSWERYTQGGPVITSGHDKYDNACAEVPKKKKAKRGRRDEDGKTRKFTREDEILLVRGIMRHGNKSKSWKLIYNEQPLLHHIKQPALKDRARSNRFKAILARAELDPSLLDRPDELCGGADGPAYERDDQSTAATGEESWAITHLAMAYASETSGDTPDLTLAIDEYYKN